MIISLDCGFHHGEHLLWFLKAIGKQEYKYYAFEANPELASNKFFQKCNMKDFEFINKAVSTENGKRIFNIMERSDQSSFYFKDYAKVVKQIEVETIDFSEWVQEHVNPKDFIVLKLDIEGEEYAILERMVVDGTIQLIDELYCEFHDKKIRGLNGAEKEDLIKQIEEKGCMVKGHN